MPFSVTGDTESPYAGHLLIRGSDLTAALVQVLSEIQLEEIGLMGLTHRCQHPSFRDQSVRDSLPFSTPSF